ncbi:DUF6684 family protein [Halobellus marinus]|jgi:hypothetical protein|uniref:DUF6684 family protein n=1 Tax=Halobellus TaxID=1073986 RepID=UPI0028ADBF4B|nr:DUF6684 family protein [Halobellus sp. DFY28]
MANKIFDRDTLLDLTVNVVPLFIMGFFVVAFAVFSPFGIDPLTSSVQFGLLAVPFVLLAVLTYFAGRAVAGSEKSGDVYLPGQASVEGATPIEEEHGETDAAVDDEGGDAELEDDGSDAELDGADEADAEADAGSADDGEGDDGDSADADSDDETDS